MVNIDGLITQLNEKGTVIFCDENSELNFVIVLDNVECSKIEIDIIVASFLGDYNSSQLSILDGGVYKADYAKQ